MPGMKPTMPSRPKRMGVPGMRKQSSRRCESRSRFSSVKRGARLECAAELSGLRWQNLGLIGCWHADLGSCGSLPCRLF